MSTFRDNRVPRSVKIQGGKIVEGELGGWGRWTVGPPLVSTLEDGFVDGDYVCTPVPATQEEMREQHEWAMRRSDRKHLRPELVA